MRSRYDKNVSAPVIDPAAVCRLAASTRAVLARLRGMDRRQRRRPRRIDGDHGSQRVTAGEPLGRVTQRAEEPELGPVVVVAAAVVVEVGLLQLLDCRDGLL